MSGFLNNNKALVMNTAHGEVSVEVIFEISKTTDFSMARVIKIARH